MPQRTAPFLEGKYGWDYGESAWNLGADENWLKFSFMFDKNIDGIVDALPVASNGKAYFLTADNRLYFAVGSTYYSSPIPKWFTVVDRATGQPYTFNGEALVEVDSNTELSTRLEAAELVVDGLGTASTQNTEYFASQAGLTALETNLANNTNVTLGAAKVGYNNSTVRQALSQLEAFNTQLQSNVGTASIGYNAETLLSKLSKDVPSFEDFGAVGDGVVDDTAAINACLAASKLVRLRSNKSYRITTTINVPTGCVIAGDGTSSILVDGTTFTSTAYTAATGSGIRVNGSSYNLFEGFKVRLINPTPDLVVGAFGLQSSSNVKIRAVDIAGFTKSSLIRIDSCANCGVVESQIHDCLLSSSTPGQLTGIDVDNNRINSIGSRYCYFESNSIYNLNVSSAFLAGGVANGFGYQTDGINISHQSSNNHRIQNNTIYNVGEGVDCFGAQCLISNNHFADCYGYAVKLVHAARRNNVIGNICIRSGLAGIVIQGNTADGQNTEKNTVSDNIFMFSGTTQATNSPSLSPWTGVTSAIRVEDEGGAFVAANNLIQNNHILENGAATYGIFEDNGASNNKYYNNLVDGFTTFEFLSNVPLGSQSFDYRSAKKSKVKAAITGVGASVTPTDTTTIFNTELLDSNAEYNPTTGIFTAKAPRLVSVSSSISTTTSLAVGDIWNAKFIKTTRAGVVSEERYLRTYSTNTSFLDSFVTATISLNTGDSLRRVSSAGAGTRTTTTGVNTNYLEITEV